MTTINLTNGGTCLVDDADAEMLSKYTWSHNSCGYVQAWVDGRVLSMHRFLMNPPTGYEVDHLNCVRADNRRCNLECVTRAENVRRVVHKNTGGGVVPRNRKWGAYIYKRRKQIWLGSFNTKEEATIARKEALIKLLV